MKGLTEKQFDEKIQELIKNIKRSTTVFSDDSAKKQRLRKEKALADYFYFAKTYFPHYVKSEFGKLHRIMHTATEKKGVLNAIAAFRGAAKTSNLSIMKPIWKALRKDIRFNLKVAASKDLAKVRTAAIKAEFLFNDRIKHDFGTQVKEYWADEDFTTMEGVRFCALGYKNPIRGAINQGNRPDYIDIDDLEDHSSVSELISQKKYDYVTGEAFGALDPAEPGYFIWLGNLTHPHMAMNKFKEECEEGPNPCRKMLIFKIDDGNYNPTWSERFTKDAIKKMRQAMGFLNFERHMRMNPIIEGKVFKEEWFKYGIIAGPKPLLISYCDPGWSSKAGADFKAIMTLYYKAPNYYLVDCWNRAGATINDMIKKLYALDAQYNNILFYMESNFTQKFLWDYIPPIAEKMGYTIPINPIENYANKMVRIETLQPLFEFGWIYFKNNKDGDEKELINQLLAYPNAKLDGPDALAGAVAQVKLNANQDLDNYESLEKLQSNNLRKLF